MHWRLVRVSTNFFLPKTLIKTPFILNEKQFFATKKTSNIMIENRLISLLRKTKSVTSKMSSSFPRECKPISSPQSRFYSFIPATETSVTRNFIGNGLRSLGRNNDKDFYKLSFRKFSTAASSAAKDGEGLKFLVTAGRHAQKAVGIWLFASAACVFSMVVLGGVTRLARSGLSMTDWNFTGSLPPLSDDEWLIEFDKYKQSPEYKRINKGMSLADFKFLYWMEYAHRIWGRALGIMFVLPFSYFLRKGYITPQLGLRLCGLFALGAGQGLIGWWMVKRGLEEPISKDAEPRVSPYRLAAHLTSAFILYSGLFWTALSVVMPEPLAAKSLTWIEGAFSVRFLAVPVSMIVATTAVTGAFVAGNDAGRANNTFPKMGDTWIPDGIFSLKPLIRDYFENPATLQCYHRIFTTASLISICHLWWFTRKLDMHPAIRSLIGSTMGMAAAQVTLGLLSYEPGSLGFEFFLNSASSLEVTLGISTMLSSVPVSLGSAHQTGELTLLTLMILLNHTVRSPALMLLKYLRKTA